jgi:hypothetical protein
MEIKKGARVEQKSFFVVRKSHRKKGGAGAKKRASIRFEGRGGEVKKVDL